MAAVVTAPDAAKVATLTSGGELAYFSFPIEKVEDAGDGEVIVTGKATDGTLDSDLQIVDPDWSMKALREWYDTGGNVRVQHQAQRDPAGRGLMVRGHDVRVRVVEPVAAKLVKAGVLQDFSIGIMNPDVLPRTDPRVRHLDPAGKAVGGIITGRPDGMTKIGELSLVDRGSNFGTKFAMVKAAADGSAQWVGELTAPDDVIAKVSAPRVYRSVSVDLPKSMRIKVSPAQLAKMNTLAQRTATAVGAVTKTADVAKGAESDAGDAGKTGADSGASDNYNKIYGQLKDLWETSGDALKMTAAEEDAALKTVGDAEDAVLGKGDRTFNAQSRRGYAESGTALADGSYPMPDADAVRRAAILIRSKHGNWKAAAKLLARRVRALGIPNPLKNKVKGPQAHKEAAPGAVKKKKVMCSSCGARQNVKHSHCPECGSPLRPGAVPVTKNHDFTCLKCGKTPLDKGEKHCPDCGQENPGYLEVADQKIPMNEDKAAKERVETVTEKARKGKGGKKGKKGKKMPFGGAQAKPFGAKDDDDAPDKAKAAAVVKKKKGGKGRSPAVGSVSQDTEGLPPHREPDGPPVEMFEQDTMLQDGDSEMKAAMRLKTLGIEPDLGYLHDLTCPAFTAADVAKCFPAATFASIDTGWWQRRALEAAAGSDMTKALAAYNEAAALSAAAVTLKTASPQLLADLRAESHAAFLAANKVFADATPGPGSFPTPSHPMPGQFRRPYISAGHGAPAPQSGPARSFNVPEGQTVASDFHRGFLSSGHASDSPANDGTRTEPQPQPMTGGMPETVHYDGTMRDNARQALSAMHDHVSRVFPDVCPMSPAMGDTQKPGHPVPDAVGGPEPHKGKTAKPKPTRAERKAAQAQKAAKTAKVKADQARKAAKAQVRKAAAAVLPVPTEPVPVAPDATPDIAAIVKAATRPLLKRQAKQDKRLRLLTKTASAIADQRDTSGAPFRGAGVAKTMTSAAPAGPLTAAKSAEQAQTAHLQRLHSQWRNSYNPAEREAAYREMTTILGISPSTPSSDFNSAHPFTT